VSPDAPALSEAPPRPQWLTASGSEWDVNTCKQAAAGGNLQVCAALSDRRSGEVQ
jgi:hypothetical protein